MIPEGTLGRLAHDMRIYTKTGDSGETGLFDGTRVKKHDVRVAGYGEIDELNSVLGWLRAGSVDEATSAEIGRIQHDLFDIGADLATPGATATEAFLNSRTQDLETWIDALMDALPKLKSFILPGGCHEAAVCHVARAVCRRAERACWQAHEAHAFPPGILVYLNRLSDLLFALARQLNASAGVADVEWQQRT